MTDLEKVSEAPRYVERNTVGQFSYPFGHFGFGKPHVYQRTVLMVIQGACRNQLPKDAGYPKMQVT